MKLLSFVKLVSEEILEPIAHSNWEDPSAPVVCPDASIRFCGDYKQTFN